MTLITALIAWGTISALALFSSLLLAAVAGVVIGWVRQAISRSSRFGESLIAALFGANLTRDPLPLVFLDLFIRAAVGYSVGICFVGLDVLNTDATNPLIPLISGGAGGGPEYDRLLVAIVLFVLGAMLIGLLVAMAIGAWAGIVLESYLFNSTAIAKLAAVGAAKGMVKDAVIAQQEYGGWRIKLGASAAKGATTGILVGLFLIILGLIPEGP
ncbi:MAG: hypothetical protein H7Z16_15920 [Pyrinomonadaceae bacterium]|nr:hypothetical protein [Pyrinomonadaceae bacterium]